MRLVIFEIIFEMFPWTTIQRIPSYTNFDYLSIKILKTRIGSGLVPLLFPHGSSRSISTFLMPSSTPTLECILARDTLIITY
jgi:hypothetical protein